MFENIFQFKKICYEKIFSIGKSIKNSDAEDNFSIIKKMDKKFDVWENFSIWKKICYGRKFFQWKKKLYKKLDDKEYSFFNLKKNV